MINGTGVNDTTREVPVATLPELFEQQVVRIPEATAVICQDAEVSYAQLNTRADQLARLLIARGIGPEQFVALAATRSVDLIVTILAVVKAGTAYLPIDPDYPATLEEMATEHINHIRTVQPTGPYGRLADQRGPGRPALCGPASAGAEAVTAAVPRLVG